MLRTQSQIHSLIQPAPVKRFFLGRGRVAPLYPRFAWPFPLPPDMLFKARHSVTLFKRPVPNAPCGAIPMQSSCSARKGKGGHRGKPSSRCALFAYHGDSTAAVSLISFPERGNARGAFSWRATAAHGVAYHGRRAQGRFSSFLALPAPLALDRGLRFPCARQSSDAMV